MYTDAAGSLSLAIYRLHLTKNIFLKEILAVRLQMSRQLLNSMFFSLSSSVITLVDGNITIFPCTLQSTDSKGMVKCFRSRNTIHRNINAHPAQFAIAKNTVRSGKRTYKNLRNR